MNTRNRWVRRWLFTALALFLAFLLGFALGNRNHRDFALREQRQVSGQTLFTGADRESAQTPQEQKTLMPLDLNHATAQELEELPGIGPERAQAIVDYREEHGLFLTPEDITKVPGIGEAVYEQVKESICVDYR